MSYRAWTNKTSDARYTYSDLGTLQASKKYHNINILLPDISYSKVSVKYRALLHSPEHN